jgi:hypothetical protein
MVLAFLTPVAVGLSRSWGEGLYGWRLDAVVIGVVCGLNIAFFSTLLALQGMGDWLWLGTAFGLFAVICCMAAIWACVPRASFPPPPPPADDDDWGRGDDPDPPPPPIGPVDWDELERSFHADYERSRMSSVG